MDGADAGLGAAATPLQPGAGAEQVIEIIHEKNSLKGREGPPW